MSQPPAPATASEGFTLAALTDTFISSLLARERSLWLDEIVLEHLGSVLCRLRRDLEQLGHTPRDAGHPAMCSGRLEVRPIQQRVASMAVARLVYHWTDNLIQPRERTGKRLADEKYRLPIEREVWERLLSAALT